MTTTAESDRTAIEVRGLEKRFGAFTAVAGLTFSVRRGEVFGLLGPNGAGKSTTIRMLCGLLRPSGGSGRVAGFDIVRETERIKTRIGYMSQRFSLYDELTVEENLDFYAGIYRVTRSERGARKEWALEMADLKDRRRTRTSELAGGWKQRLALGCAVLHQPSILFLDEPTSGVDPLSRRRFWDLIYTLAESGVTILVTTHYMEEAEYCDLVGIVFRGQLIALDSPRALQHRHQAGRLYNVRCNAPAAAAAALETDPAVSAVRMRGDTLELTLRERGDEHVVKKRVERAGCAVRSIEPAMPSLEEVFVSLIEAHDQADQQTRVVKP